MKQHDVNHFVKCSDKYVAYVGDILHVIASGTSMTEVQNKLTAQHVTKATITYIPPIEKSVTLSTP
jgi:hypothetical protein